MNCRETDRLIGVFRDGELDEALARLVEGHLRDCADCRAKEKSWQRTSTALRQEFQADVPDGLAERAFRSAMAAEPAPTSFFDTLLPLAWRTALATTAAAAALVIASLVVDVEEPGSVEPEFLAFASSTNQVQGVLEDALGLSGGTQ